MNKPCDIVINITWANTHKSRRNFGVIDIPDSLGGNTTPLRCFLLLPYPCLFSTISQMPSSDGDSTTLHKQHNNPSIMDALYEHMVALLLQGTWDTSWVYHCNHHYSNVFCFLETLFLRWQSLSIFNPHQLHHTCELRTWKQAYLICNKVAGPTKCDLIVTCSISLQNRQSSQ